jgi:2-polyprenyl-6-methoxyphenol hydroxylase-like FAD-dependent oxidoreductase
MKRRTAANSTAVVIGASVAGLLAARVLADHFGQVLLLERDPHPGDAWTRPGVPQTSQTHVLLPGGARILERLFPEKLQQLVGCGAKAFDYGRSRFNLNGRWMPRIDTGLYSYAQTRRLLESQIRSWLTEYSNVSTVYNTIAVRLITEEPLQIVGVEATDLSTSRALSFEAALVIDASGRGTRFPKELQGLGLEPPPEIRVGIDVGYTSGLFRLPSGTVPDHPLTYIVGPPPHNTRVGAVIEVEDRTFHVGLAGYHGDHPPKEMDGFLAFSAGLSQPDIHTLLLSATPLTPLSSFRVPYSFRRQYARIPNFPAGFLPIGDAISSFDPVFAQGMSVAALEADLLSRCLAKCSILDQAFSRLYLNRIEQLMSTPWKLSIAEGFRYQQTTGPRPYSLPITRYIKDRLLATNSDFVLRTLYHVLTLTSQSMDACSPAAVLDSLL